MNDEKLHDIQNWYKSKQYRWELFATDPATIDKHHLYLQPTAYTRSMRVCTFIFLIMVSYLKDASCFLPAAPKTKRQNITRPKAGWKDNLDNASKEVKKSGMAETATGAVLGKEYYIMSGSFLVLFCPW